MSETKLEYQVDSEGRVLNLKTTKGQPYTLSAFKPAGDVLPWPRSGYKTDKWQALKREICSLPPGQWFYREGFPSKDELKLARNTVAKWKTDSFMYTMLNGKTLEASADYNGLRLAIRISEEKDVKQG